MAVYEAETRQPGLDHEFFPFRRLIDPIKTGLAEDTPVVLSPTVVLQRYHIDVPPAYAVPGMLDRPYPDIGNFTQRDSGLREGLWRLCDLFDRLDIPVNFVVELDALDGVQDSLDVLKDQRHAVLAGGKHATCLHSDQLSPNEESAIIKGVKSGLEEATGRSVSGWRSPSCAQSSITMRLLCEAGFGYIGDLNSDDLPFTVTTESGSLVSVPMHHYSSDLHMVHVNRQPFEAFIEGYRKGIDWLIRCSKTGKPVVLPMVLHPWISGSSPFFSHIETFFEIYKDVSHVGCMNADRISEAFRDANAPNQ